LFYSRIWLRIFEVLTIMLADCLQHQIIMSLIDSNKSWYGFQLCARRCLLNEITIPSRGRSAKLKELLPACIKRFVIGRKCFSARKSYPPGICDSSEGLNKSLSRNPLILLNLNFLDILATLTLRREFCLISARGFFTIHYRPRSTLISSMAISEISRLTAHESI
jgi:hypothetical protein